MDIDAVKDVSEEQMEMMVMMLQTGKMSELSGFQAVLSDPMTGNSSFTHPCSSSTPCSFIDPDYPAFLRPAAGGFMQCPTGNYNANDGASTNKDSSMSAMRQMIFRAAAMQPVHIDPESVKPPKRRNVKISKDPQSVAARHRRERISERIRILQRLVPGGTKMDTASMLDEAARYVKFLKIHLQSLEQAAVMHTTNGVVLADRFEFLNQPMALPGNYGTVPRVYPTDQCLVPHSD